MHFGFDACLLEYARDVGLDELEGEQGQLGEEGGEVCEREAVGELRDGEDGGEDVGEDLGVLR